jgi:hypothetical protein
LSRGDTENGNTTLGHVISAADADADAEVDAEVDTIEGEVG